MRTILKRLDNPFLSDGRPPGPRVEVYACLACKDMKWVIPGEYSMGLLIDSGVLIAAERGRIQLHQVIGSRRDEPIAISVITASELLHGVDRAMTPGQEDKRRQFVEFVLNLFPVAAIDLEVARCHARIWAGLQVRGQMIGAHDLLIAATAIAHHYTLLTLNVNEFRRVPELTVENPLEG